MQKYGNVRDSTYYTNAWQRQLLVEAGDFDRLEPILCPCPNQSMESILDPCKDFRIAFKDCNNLSICLLQHPDRTGYHFGPFCQSRSVMGGAKEHNAAG